MTALSELRRPLRILIGDTDDGVHAPVYRDAALDDAVWTALTMGRVAGYQLAAEDATQITPDILPPAGDPNAFSLLLLLAARILVLPSAAAMSLRTRAATYRRGALSELLRDWERQIGALTAGSLYQSWTMWESSVCGISGASALASLIEQSVVFTRAGLAAPTVVLDGQYTWSNAMSLVGANLTGLVSVGQDTVIAAQVNGVTLGDLALTLAAGVYGTSGSASAALNHSLAVGDVLRWVVTSSPAVLESQASQLTLTARLQPVI